MKIKECKRCLPAVAVLALLAAWGGCESDPVAPHDTIPALTEEGAANQAAMIALAVNEVAPLAVDYSLWPAAKTDPPYQYYFDGSDNIDGTVALDYRNGSPTGTHAAVPALAGYVTIFNVYPEGVTITTPLGGQLHITATIIAALTHGLNESAEILTGSGGTLDAGAYSAVFTIEDLVVTRNGWPTGGPIVFTGGGHEVEVMFNGTAVVTLSLDGVDRWTFNLDTLTLTEI